MNAADVLAEALDPDGLMNPDGDYDPLVDALLAHGERGEGVTIEADGELHPNAEAVPDGWKVHWIMAESSDEIDVPVLVPLSAEAGDTDG
jgi:hypothetical protein